MGPVPPEKQDQLRALLASLPGDMAARLCALAGEADPALGRLLSSCVGDPAKAARERFFAPVAPLTGTPGETRPAVCVAPQGLLEAVWDWMGDEIAPDAVRHALDAVSDFDAPDNPGQLDPDRTSVAEAITARLNAVKNDPKAQQRLQARLGVEDFDAVRDVAALLRLAPVLRAALNGVPSQIVEPDPELCALIRDRYETAAAAEPDAGPWLLLLVMARFVRPWRVLRVFERLTHREDDLLAGSTDMAVIGDVLLGDAEHHLQGFSRVPRSEAGARAAAGELAAFAAVTIGMTREIGIRKDGPWGRRIVALRARASEQMSAIHDAARRALSRALPEPGPVRRRPSAPDPSDLEAARALCLFLALTRDDAGRAAVAGAHSMVMEDMTGLLERAGQGALDDLRAAEGPAREIAEARLEAVAGLLRALGQGEAGAVLLRRGAAACAA
ncbi:hypothetical protein F1654_04070 [Alkalicaulis satelles]|uniref:Uncharacterized protein n=1 Tax=Alkalicaulis satelles TaxID=2609175 RepID=A0A5M6ZK38_9PROT|nr:hypothetical protein [Alkalicaulis satelles]KAA5805169.1 hypothetical protein F1654_04070 [Alkalicaulis satelles]